MSGFEVAGIVLGAFPLAISALEKWQDVARRLGLFNHIRLEHQKCMHELGFHRLIFTRHLRQLLLPLVADGDMIKELMSDPGGPSWRQPEISSLLERKLQDSYELYLQHMNEIARVMIEVTKELALDSGTIQDKLISPKLPSGTARARQGVVMSKENWEFQRYRTNFSNREGVRARLFAELKSCNDKLEKLLDSSEKDMELVQQKGAASASSIDSAITNFWRQAETFYRTLALAWNCCCWKTHSTSLLLQHRTAKTSDFNLLVTTPVQEQGWKLRRARVLDNLDVDIEVIGTSIKTITLSQPTPAALLKAPSHRESQPRKTAFRSKNRTAQVQLTRQPTTFATTVIDTSRIEVKLNPISELCSALDEDQKCCGFLTTDDQNYYVYPIYRKTLDRIESVTLEEILRGAIRPRPSRKERFGISLVLASSYLQLLESQWLPSSWDKSDVVFFKDDEKQTKYLLDRPHIGHRISPAGEPGVDRPLCTLDTQTLTRLLDQLGIILLELCFGEPLDQQEYRLAFPTGNTAKEKAAFDVIAAREWQCEVNEEVGPDYAGAVGWCLGGNRAGYNNETWRRDMLQRVVKPLEKCYNYLGGAGVPVV